MCQASAWVLLVSLGSSCRACQVKKDLLLMSYSFVSHLDEQPHLKREEREQFEASSCTLWLLRVFQQAEILQSYRPKLKAVLERLVCFGSLRITVPAVKKVKQNMNSSKCSCEEMLLTDAKLSSLSRKMINIVKIKVVFISQPPPHRISCCQFWRAYLNWQTSGE